MLPIYGYSGYLHNNLDGPYRWKIYPKFHHSGNCSVCSRNHILISHSLLVICFFKLLHNPDLVRTKFQVPHYVITCLVRNSGFQGYSSHPFSWRFFQMLYIMFFDPCRHVKHTTSRLVCYAFCFLEFITKFHTVICVDWFVWNFFLNSVSTLTYDKVFKNNVQEWNGVLLKWTTC